ncbi:MAG: hypothetical protein JNM14_02485 [Ferruginibacter sp.]|nr:hypothetical protein [Ferruginibacter sp.]
MSTKIETFYITHLIPDDLPEKGMRKLLFYTTTEQGYNEGIYFWGLDIKNPFTENDLSELEKSKKVIKILPSPIKVKRGIGLWLNSEGKVYTGNIKNYKDGELEPVFSPSALSKATQIYNKSIGSSKVPSTRTLIGI